MYPREAIVPRYGIDLMALPMLGLANERGPNGGMDATGNQCNDTATVTTVVSSESATFPSASLPKAETNQAASSNKSMIKHTAASARSRIKRS
jgi:hypothetical protein